MSKRVLSFVSKFSWIEGFWRMLIDAIEVNTGGMHIGLPLSPNGARFFSEWIHGRWDYGPAFPPLHLFIGSNLSPTMAMAKAFEHIHYCPHIRKIKFISNDTPGTGVNGKIIYLQPTTPRGVVIRFVERKMNDRDDKLYSISGGEWEHRSPPTDPNILYAWSAPTTIKRPKRVLFMCGTSSAGKSTVSRLLRYRGYSVVHGDDLWNGWGGGGLGKQFDEAAARVVATRTPTFGLQSGVMCEMMLEAALHEAELNPVDKLYRGVIIDTIEPLIPSLHTAKSKALALGMDPIEMYIYAPIEDMIRNMASRIGTEFRGKFVLSMFKSYYKAISPGDQPKPDGAIDRMRRKEGRERMHLLDSFFDSKLDSTTFIERTYDNIGMIGEDWWWIGLNNRASDSVVINTRGLCPHGVCEKVRQWMKKEKWPVMRPDG